MANVPKLRFEGFADAWEQRKVSDVAEITAGGTPSTAVTNYWEPKEIPWLSSGEVHKKYIYFTDNKISTEGMNNSSARMVKENSVLIALAGQGKTRGTVAINRIPLTTNQSIAAMTFSEEIVPEFVFCNLDGRYDEIRKMSSGDGARGGLNKQIVGDIIIPYTSKPEQEQIGRFFSNIDDLITLHQRKCDALRNAKKFYLQNMFTQNGETEPSLRFKGFTDAWEQRKLSSIVERVTRKNTELESTLPLTISAQYGLVDQVTYFNNRVASQNISNYYLVKKGEFAYNKSSSDGYPFGAVKRLDLYEMGVLSTLYVVFALKDSNVDSGFLACYYDTDNWHKQVSERAAEGARNHGLLNISAEDFLDTELMIPSEKEEQALIGRYLKKLDHLITLHQHKCEALKTMKKFMLQNMFPRED